MPVGSNGPPFGRSRAPAAGRIRVGTSSESHGGIGADPRLACPRARLKEVGRVAACPAPDADRLRAMDEKAALRERMRRLRAAIPEDERERLARTVEDRLLALPELRGGRTVMVFSSFGSEIPTDRILAGLRSRAARVLLPYVEGDRMGAAELRSGDEMVATSYGPKEPPVRVNVPSEEIDVVIAPGVAFDRRGHRLGYGGGHYDRFLRTLRPDAARIGIAFDVQVLDEIPHDPGDERLDILVTDRQTMRTGR